MPTSQLHSNCRYRIISLTAVVALVFALSEVDPAMLHAADESPAAGKQVSLHFAKSDQADDQLDYTLFLPQAYDTAPGRWPLIVFLHGAGECGPGLEKVKVHGPPKLVEKRPEDFQFIVASPQCPPPPAGIEKWSDAEKMAFYVANWSHRPVMELIDSLCKTYRVDERRIYLTGLSMGGFGTWEFATRNPDRFAAIAPVCGGGKPELVSKLRTLPVWAFHGDGDTVVTLDYSTKMVNALEAAGGQVKLTVYPGVGHDSWTDTYNNPDLYQWLLSHRR